MAAAAHTLEWVPPAVGQQEALLRVLVELPEAAVGLGRIAALHYRSPTSCQIHEQIRWLYFWSDDATEPRPRTAAAAVAAAAAAAAAASWWT